MEELTKNEFEAEETAESTAEEPITETETAETAEVTDDGVSEENTETEEPAEDESKNVLDDNEASDEEVPQSELTEKKKPFILQKTIIIACCIFAAALVAFGAAKLAYYIFNPGIEGTWVLTKAYLDTSKDDAYEPDGDKSTELYLSFKDDSDLIIKTGSVSYKYKWSYVDENDNKVNSRTDKVKYYIDGAEEYSASFSFIIEGNRFSECKMKTEGNKLLYSTYGEDVEIDEYKSCGDDMLNAYKMKVSDDFKADDALIGSWYNKDNEVTITFNEDGSYAIESSSNLQEGTYICDKEGGTVEFGYFSFTEGSTGTISYEIKDNKLDISGEEFEKKN